LDSCSAYDVHEPLHHDVIELRKQLIRAQTHNGAEAQYGTATACVIWRVQRCAGALKRFAEPQTCPPWKNALPPPWRNGSCRTQVVIKSRVASTLRYWPRSNRLTIVLEDFRASLHPAFASREIAGSPRHPHLPIRAKCRPIAGTAKHQSRQRIGSAAHKDRHWRTILTSPVTLRDGSLTFVPSQGMGSASTLDRHSPSRLFALEAM